MEKQKQILRIVDKYIKILEKIPYGDKIDPALARKLKIPESFIPILEKAYKAGRVNAITNLSDINPLDMKRAVDDMGAIKNPIYELGKNATKDSVDYNLSRLRAKISHATVEALKPSYGVIGEAFKDDMPPERWLATELRKITSDHRQDRDMVVKTEIMNKNLDGYVEAIVSGDSPYSNEGLDTEVYKVPNPDACIHCKTHYLETPYGLKPKVFKLSELLANGSNYGKKTGERKAVYGTMHPHCQCSMHVMPKGYEFDDGGNIIKKGEK